MKLNVHKYINYESINKKRKTLISLKSKYQKFQLKKIINAFLKLIIKSNVFKFKNNLFHINYFKSRFYYLSRNLNIYYGKLNKKYCVLKKMTFFPCKTFYTRYGKNWLLFFIS